MSAHIVDLGQFRAQRAARGQTQTAAVAPQAMQTTQTTPTTQAPFKFWSGATGTRYVHTIYNLLDCPPLAPANYILVKRHLDGRRTVMLIGRLANDCPTLNLAEIRQRSATLGANEIHIHMLADDSAQSREIEADLRRSLVLA